MASPTNLVILSLKDNSGSIALPTAWHTVKVVMFSQWVPGVTL